VGNSRGRLDVVATPIGNLSDLSPRAQEVLASADVIAAEDTRHTGALLKAIGVSRPLVSLHSHNESNRVPELLARLAAGDAIALVSDAGTPLLSDPGYELRSSERRTRLEAVAADPRTLVFFEAPHRIEECLADLAAVFGSDRMAAVARELTKAHETIYRGTLGELTERAKTEPNFARGEITVVVQGAREAENKAEAVELERVVALLVRELAPSRAAALAAQITGARRNDAYALAMKLAKSADSASDVTDG
jgi:16S rRNA (cytidine1402-2'-O)-methyltransferase